MNKYIVAYISFFDYELKQSIVTANSEIEAIALSEFMKDFTKELTNEELDEITGSLDDVKQYAFDCDSMISVIQID